MSQEPIRVAQIIGKWVGGGVESVVMNYYRYIDKTKVQFDFICDEDSIKIPYDEIKKMGGKVILIPPYQKAIKYHNELKKVLKNGNYKIVHSHINTLSIFSLFAAKCAGIPIRIAHSHSTTNKKEKKKNLLKTILKPFSKLFSTNYMACTEYAGRWLFGNKTFNEGKVTIINNAIDTEKFSYNEVIRNKIRNELKINNNFVIGHIGRFVEQKNHTFLIDLFNEVKKEKENAKLLLIGEGPLKETIEKKVEYLNLKNDVKFLGQKENVNELMQGMDCFLFPSLYEGLGIVTIEAQCAGLRCICSKEIPNEANITDLFEYCDINNIDEWIKKINAKRDIQRRKYKQDIINNSYEITEEAKKIEKIYLKLMKPYITEDYDNLVLLK